MAPVDLHGTQFVEPVVYDSTIWVDKVEKIGKQADKAVNAQATEIQHSGPQGKVVPLTIIDDPADWKSKDLKPEEYSYQLSDTEVAEIIAATDAILARGVSSEDDIKKLTRDDYLPNLPTLADNLRKVVHDNVSSGRGFLLVKGFPVEHYKDNRVGLVVAYWGWALVLGRVQISQTDRRADGSIFGSIFNHITVGRWADVWKDPRAYPTNVDSQRLNFHSDQGATDVLALLCLTPAKEGGESLFVSAIAIHNELLRRGRKDLVEVLSTPGIWYTAQQEDQRAAFPLPDGSFEAYEETQPFEYHQGYLSVHFGGRKFGDTAKKLTPLQEEAIWTVAAIAEDPDFHIRYKLQPGETIILHNPSTFHARTQVIDGANRHLVRWWVHTDLNERPIAPHYVPRSNVGPRGGFQVPDYDDLSKQRLPLYPYSRHDGLGQSPVI